MCCPPNQSTFLGSVHSYVVIHMKNSDLLVLHNNTIISNEF